METTQNLSTLQVTDLHYIVTAYCIELQAYRVFKGFYEEAPIIAKQLRAIPKDIGITPTSLDSTEAFAFFST